MITRRFSSADGTSLCADVYDPSDAGPGRGLLVLVHGFGEHRGRYHDTAGFLAQQGYQVACLDLRGHGESGGTRAYVERFADYLQDVEAVIKEMGAQDPVLLVGHSMGGLVALNYVLRHPERVRALALSSPFLGLKLKVPVWKRWLAQACSSVLPTLKVPSDLDPALLSHDPQVVAAYARDPLVVRHATARWFTEVLAAQAEVLRAAPRVSVPTLFLCAGDDRVVDAAVSQRVFDRLPGSIDKMMTLYPGLYHEIFNEVERDRVLQDLATWLARH